MPIDRNSGPAAKEVCARLLPNRRSRGIVLGFLATAIREAHARTPAGWGVTLTEGMIRLNVGRIETLTIGPGVLHLTLLGESVPSAGDESPDIFRSPAGQTVYRSVPGSVRWGIPLARFAAIREALIEPHRVLIELAAATASRTSWADSHSPGVLRHLEGELGMSLPNPAYSFPHQDGISPLRFRHAFDRFQRLHLEDCGERFEGFGESNSTLCRNERYKSAIPDRAMAVLEPRKWSRTLVGTGEILAKVIGAIELPGNNLLQWQGRNGPNSRVHLKLIEARSESVARRELEELFFSLYRRGQADQSVFESLMTRCGRRYELLAYLFFLAKPERFLPVRTQSFDRAFAELGIGLRTEGQCGWENYQSFLEALAGVRRSLHDEGIANASLLDAHSFCWILARTPAIPDANAGELPIVFLPFEGDFAPASERRISPNDDAQVRDMQAEAQRRQASGRIAEEMALTAERKRLSDLGRPDLAARIEPCGDRPGLGFDIMSFEADGTERCIEVKNVSNGRRFFLSECEWQNSRQRPNYWFYLVDCSADSVTPVRADRLRSEHLHAVQYLVTYRA